MSKTYQLGICGCGDFLRWNAPAIRDSKRVAVRALFDPDASRAEHYAGEVGGSVVDSADAIFDDGAIDVVLLFVPPMVRKEQMLRAARAGQHILTTKPLAPHVAECEEIRAAVEGKVRCGVMYRRTGGGDFEAMRRLFDSGEIGKLALFKEDWLHHYPQWNDWALDPDKNGGPFMDAMVHNLNIARYLMARPAQSAIFFGEKLAHDLPCNDTESIRVGFEGGVAELLITWAADLEVQSTEGNYREHIDLFYMITDQGWRVVPGKGESGKPAILASREGTTREFPIKPLPGSVFDRFAEALDSGGDLPSDLVSLEDATWDIRIVRESMARAGVRVTF
jgi:predicted dehydrogenase